MLKILYTLLLLSAHCSYVLAVGKAFYPADDNEVLESLPKGEQHLLDPVSRNSNSVSAVEAARAIRNYLSLSSETGDERYLGYADVLLNKVEDGNSVELQLAKAALLQRRHEFDQALIVLNDIIKEQPRHGEAHLMAAYIYLAQGKGKEAAGHCAGAGAVLGNITGLSCSASAQSLMGELERNYSALSTLLSHWRGSNVERREALLSLAEIARMRGDYDLAERHYRDALFIDSGDSFLLMRLADLYLSQQEYEKCTMLLGEHQGHLSLMLRSAIAGKQAEQQDDEERRSRLSNYFELQKLRNPKLATRDYGEYLLQIQEQSEQALVVALQNWQSQREVADAELLVRAAIRAQDLDALKPLLAWLRNTGLRDARIQQQLASVNIEL
jgi:tetratricopeptide (TPR) repeat protein